METVTLLGKTNERTHATVNVFTGLSLPANVVQSAGLQANGNGSFFTQGVFVLGSAEGKKRPGL